LNDCINGEDTFYEFKFNRVYTISSLIDQYKKGRKGRFIGIKEVDDDSCESTVNKFPVNDGFRNFDFLYFLFAILMIIIQPVGLILLVVAHIILFLYNLVIQVICSLCKICFLGICPFRWICRELNIKCDKKDYTLRLPMITYPNCQACECESDYNTSSATLPANPNSNATGVLTYLSAPEEYYDNFSQLFSADTNGEALSIVYSEAISGRAERAFINDSTVYKLPLSQNLQYDGPHFIHASSKTLPLGERINIFNARKNYFDNINKIKVQVEPNLNVGKYHYDNTITVLSNQQLNAGDVITMVDPNSSSDSNWLYSASTADGIITGISGTSYSTTAATQVNVSYATSTTAPPQIVQYNVPYGSEPKNYKVPSDIEYFQVVTAITWSDAVNMWNPNTPESFPNIIYSQSTVNLWKGASILTGYNIIANSNITPIEYYSDIASQYILVLQRGVDPYSPKYVQKYQLGNLFGTGENDPNFTITATTRLNIPIQPNSNPSTSIQSYNQNEMFFQSYFFSPGIVGSTTVGQEFSAYTTVNTGYYGLLDSQQPIPADFNSSGNEVITKISNAFYNTSPNGSFYDSSEDMTGLGAMGGNNYISIYHTWNNYLPFFDMKYYSKTIYQGVPWSALTISNRTKNILRTDRLPSSDKLDGGNWGNNPSLLQQNLVFNFNLINLDTEDLTSQAFSTGADIPTADLEGLTTVKILESFDCEKMVGLDCYKGFGSNFEINQNCTTKDAVENGCYMFLRRLIRDIPKDFNNFAEWSFRFRFFYGLCRGVLSQSFMNNWVNGSLYMFPIQVDTFYDKQNKPLPPKFCNQIAYFDVKTNNFYYRSSPYNENLNKFVGMQTNNVGSVNKLNLLFPTTVINLGMKDSFFGEITFDPDTRAYIIPNIDSTSYGDTSDLINLFVISRITDETFLKQIISFGDNSLNQLFSRGNEGAIKNRRIDGDLAQLMSINSEIGNINFSPEFYETAGGPPTTILGSASDPIVAVWFSSTTEDLQIKDYLTPGRIDFRGPNNVGFYPYPYGIKSQIVPFYKWKLANTATIFGNQNNNWATDTPDIIQNTYYQGLDRASQSTKYFLNQSSSISDLNARGYIFSVDSSGNYISTGAVNQSFLVGAPFHFYFGVVKGESALDKFKTKYSIGE
jgi:hypothetical protein